MEPDQVELTMTWNAYTSKHFNAIYDQHADRIGHRPAFGVCHGGDHARVLTNTADADTAQAIINDAEAANAQ